MTTLSTSLNISNTTNVTDPAVAYSFSLSQLAKIFKAPQSWINEQEKRAKRVARYRAYYDGDHDAKLTPEMMALLRIKDADDGFTLNMMPSIVDTKADRCIVQTIDAVEDKAAALKQAVNPAAETDDEISKDPRRNPAAWIQEVMEENRFDILQGDVNQAAIRDGDAFFMVSWDNDEECARWTFEEAFDGSTGMLAYYPSRNIQKAAAMLKIWQTQLPNMAGDLDFATRVNIYYPDRVEKYQSISGGDFQPFIDLGEESHILPWTDRNGNPLGIPVIHFRNGGRHNYGTSELRNAISPQNALNRFNYSAVMIAELTGFSIMVARGWPAPATITPGYIYNIAKEGLTTDQVADLIRLPAGDLAPILSIMDKERQLIADITRTPSAQLIGGTGIPSGEYLKQLEIGLLGKVRTYHNIAGAALEMVADMTWKVQAAYGKVQPPPYKRFRTMWRSAEIRNDTEIVANAMAMNPVWGDEWTLRETSDVFDLEEADIKQIMAEKKGAPTITTPDTNSGSLPPPASNYNGTIPAPPVASNITDLPPRNNPPAIGGAARSKPIPSISDAELANIFKLHSMMMSAQ